MRTRPQVPRYGEDETIPSHDGPSVAHQLAEYGDVIDEPETAYGAVLDAADEPTVSHQLAEYGEEVVDIGREPSSPGALYDSKTAVAAYILDEDNALWRGFLDGAFMAPQGLAIGYDTYRAHDEEHTPYSIHGIMNELRDEEKTRAEYVGNGAGFLAGSAAVYVAPAAFFSATVLDALDAGDRKMEELLG